MPRTAGSSGTSRARARCSPQPLEARAGGAFASLDATVEPLLEVWSRPVANELTTVRLRQRVAPGERLRGTYSKTIYVTLSPDAP